MRSRYALSQIDELLIKEGFVKRNDMEKAYHIRSENMQKAKRPLGMILNREGMISKQDLSSLLSHKETQHKIMTALLKRGLINKKQVRACQSRNPQKPLTCPDLLKAGYITRRHLDEATRGQLDSLTFGRLALKNNMISEKNLENALSIKKQKKSISEILHGMHLITLTELNHVFQKFNRELKLGKILVQQELISGEELREILEEQKSKKSPLGQLLVKKGWLTIAQLYFALSIQFNIPYQSLTGFAFYEKQKLELKDIVDQRCAEKNMLLPLFLNESHLTLGLCNPTSISSMQELAATHNQIKMTPVLITEEKFEQLFILLYGEIFDRANSSSQQISEYGSTKKKLIITSPREQSWLINKLFARYKKLSENCGKTVPDRDLKLFHEFINESYQAVCRKFQCRSIWFWFEIKNNGVKINTSPHRSDPLETRQSSGAVNFD